MRIDPGCIVFFCFVNLVRGGSEVDDSEAEVRANSEWWSRRITKINTVEATKKIGLLASEDSQRHNRQWEIQGTEDPRRRPRPFTSLDRRPDMGLRRGFESQAERVPIDKKGESLINSDGSVPSPILLPPYASPSFVFKRNRFENDPTLSRNNKSTSTKKSTNSAIDRIRIYEITTFNSTNNEVVDDNPSYIDNSSRISDVEDENRLIDIVRQASINITKTSSQQTSTEVEANNPNSIYIDEERDNIKRVENSKPAFNRSNRLKNARGSRKYHHDSESDRSFMRKRMFSSAGKYEWRRRPVQRVNHFKFNSDSNTKNGAVPGVPGRDYPVHQEHTHHHLRNIADRFPCPETPKTHVYLADRASRCQIFYVCYGSKTGVPMVCPNGTLFSEPLQVCDWWFNVQC